MLFAHTYSHVGLLIAEYASGAYLVAIVIHFVWWSVGQAGAFVSDWEDGTRGL
jgi:hypothetical protein